MAEALKEPDFGSITQSLSFKQARIAVFAAVVLGIGFSALQILSDLENVRRETDNTFRQSLKAFEDSAYQAAFGLDKVLAGTVVDGLFQNSAIFEARIVDDFGDVLAMVERPQKRGRLKWLADKVFGLSRQYETPLQPNNASFRAGKLSIRVDSYVIAETFLQRSGLILASGVLRNLILAIILAGLFYYMLTKPVRLVAASIKRNRGDVAVPENHSLDELGGLVTTINDLSHQRSRAEDRLRDFADAASDWFWEMGPDLRYRYHSERYFEITGQHAGDVANVTMDQLADPHELVAEKEKWTSHLAVLEARQPFKNFEFALRLRDGDLCYVRTSGKPVFAEDGSFGGYRGTGTDISSSFQAKRELRESEALYRNLIEGSLQGVCILDQRRRLLFVNQAYADIFGYESPDDVLALGTTAPLCAPYEQVRLENYRLARLRGEDAPSQYQYDGVHKDGRDLHLEAISRRIIWQGEFAVQVTLIDITERVNAQKQATEGALLLRSLIDASPSRITLKDREGRFLLVNDAFAKAWHTTTETAVGKTAFDYSSKEEAEINALQERQVLETGDIIEVERDVLAADGSSRSLRRTKFPVRDMANEIVGVGSISADVTEQRNAQRALAESEERLRGIIDNFPAAILLKDLDGRYLVCNKVFQEWFNCGPDDYRGKTVFDVMPASIAKAVKLRDEQVLREGLPQAQDFLVELPDGITRSIWSQRFPIVGSDGNCTGVGAVLIDMTIQRDIEDQLVQSQKMEALGQLTGGVAHDFNNLMSTMLGNAELIEGRVGDDTRLLRNIDRIKTAIRRGAALTDRLLAFSRKQALAPQATDIDTLIVGLDDMLRRTLGETIELVVVPCPGLWPTLTDPAQLEHALINLAVNARDAMRDGGVLTIESSNVTIGEEDKELQELMAAKLPDHASRLRPGTGQIDEIALGDFVKISVSDNGTGMSPETRKRVFEPFFTTKEIGKGSGLGLSMVYGFVKQSGGHVSIYSEIGIGTTVCLYLPRSLKKAAVQPPAGESGRSFPEQSGRILVVEDELNVREVPVSYLRDLGYHVTEAANGKDALVRLRDDPPFSLLFTDIVLPGAVSGFDVAKAAKELQPGIEVLYTTGYAEHASTADHALENTDSLIRKPYNLAELARKVDEILTE